MRPETLLLTKGCDSICAFVNDQLDGAVLADLKSGGTRLVALRCAGYNNVDLITAKDLGIPVVRVPAYSPEAVAEHTVALILALNRKIYRSTAKCEMVISPWKVWSASTSTARQSD